jgi:transporter family-2 protein
MVNGLIIAANLTTSLAIDHFGLLSAPQHSANIWRVIGGVLMAFGVALICSF